MDRTSVLGQGEFLPVRPKSKREEEEEEERAGEHVPCRPRPRGPRACEGDVGSFHSFRLRRLSPLRPPVDVVVPLGTSLLL